MKKKTFYFGILFHLLWINGCGINESDNNDTLPPDIEITTDADYYLLDSTLTVLIDVTNYKADSVYYLCYGQIYLDELEDDQVVNSWMVHGSEYCYLPVPIGPDSTARWEITLTHNFPVNSNGYPQFVDSVSYRFRVDLYANFELDSLIDESERISPEVKIVSLEEYERVYVTIQTDVENFTHDYPVTLTVSLVNETDTTYTYYSDSSCGLSAVVESGGINYPVVDERYCLDIPGYIQVSPHSSYTESWIWRGSYADCDFTRYLLQGAYDVRGVAGILVSEPVQVRFFLDY